MEMDNASLKMIGLAAVVLLSVYSDDAYAQAVDASPCKAFTIPVVEGGPEMLHVVCGNAGTILGQVDNYDLTQLPDLQAAVVTTSVEGSRRIWLVMKNEDNSLALEEITGTIARAAGREAGADVEGLDLDFGKGATGQLTANVMSSGNSVEASSTDGAVDFSQLVERARTIRASDASDNEK